VQGNNVKLIAIVLQTQLGLGNIRFFTISHGQQQFKTNFILFSKSHILKIRTKLFQFSPFTSPWQKQKFKTKTKIISNLSFFQNKFPTSIHLSFKGCLPVHCLLVSM
jgi:hypothetical protein